MYLLQWGRTCEGAESPSPFLVPLLPCRFNGAAPVKARNLPEPVLYPGCAILLQWGRTCEGAESLRRNCFDCIRTELQWGRTCEGAESVTALTPSAATR